MQQPPVQSKVLDIHKNGQKNKGIIKSRGFTQQIQEENGASEKVNNRKLSEFRRKSEENAVKPVLFGSEEEEKERRLSNNVSQQKVFHQGAPKASQYHSERIIKGIPSAEIGVDNSRIEVKKQP